MGSQRHVIEHQFTQVPAPQQPQPQQSFQQPYPMMPQQQQLQPIMQPTQQPIYVTSSPDPKQNNSAYKQGMPKRC